MKKEIKPPIRSIKMFKDADQGIYKIQNREQDTDSTQQTAMELYRSGDIDEAKKLLQVDEIVIIDVDKEREKLRYEGLSSSQKLLYQLNKFLHRQ